MSALKDQNERLAQRLNTMKRTNVALNDRLVALEATADGNAALEIERLREENVTMRDLLFSFKASIERLPTG